MDRFAAMRAFVEVAECGSFAAAARSLKLSPPGVTRAIAALEARLATRLFTRTTRLVRLTESGHRFLADTKRILAAVAEAEEAVTGAYAGVRGDLRITAPVLFGNLFIAQVMADFLDIYPEVHVEALFLDRVVHLIDEGIDVAVRIGEFPDTAMSAIKIATVRRVLCASPIYLAQHGVPQTPGDLGYHHIIRSSALDPMPHWHFTQDRRRQAVAIQPNMTLNSNDAVLMLAKRNRGICRLLSYQVARDVKAGTMKIILADFEEAPLPVHIVHVEGRQASAKVRAFIDFCVSQLRNHPELQNDL